MSETLPPPETASEWIAALQDDPMNAALRARHESWLARSEANRADWQEMLRVWRLMGQTVPAHAHEWAGYVARPQAPPRTLPGLRVLPAALRRPAALSLAGAALAACLLLFVQTALLPLGGRGFETDIAESRLISLPDGSRMLLAPGSSAEINFDERGRRVALSGGEAFFHVERREDQPFTVVTRDVAVTVLGTAFNVRQSALGSDVAVAHGKVQVNGTAQNTDPFQLTSGDILRIGTDGRARRQHAETGLIAAWRQGQLIADDQPVADAVEVLERYFDGWIFIRGEGLARQPLTGVYKLSDPKAALEAMAEAQGAHVHQISPWILIISKS
ncbi:FecR family protein [Tepidicaulis sp. LMO-SS28]|uniref:FecR family protein n=1 Tax=Tepidicaulis sp. LMO-SS28 TaxID=3447455 RepID=UPI003EE391C7